MRIFRKYVIVWIVVFVACQVGVAILNVTVDPTRRFGLDLFSSLDPFRQNNSRSAKAMQLAGGQWDIVLLGSSRVETGFDPASKVWNRAKVYNGGLNETNLEELTAAFRYMMEHNPPKTLILCLDLRMQNRLAPLNGGFVDSPLNPSLNWASYYLYGMFSFGQTGRSLESLAQAAGWIEYHDSMLPNGFRQKLEPIRGARHVFQKVLGFNFDHPKGNLDFEVNPKFNDAYREILQSCREHDTRLIVVILPDHALHLECLHNLNQWRTFEQMKRELVRITEEENEAEHESSKVDLWDFTSYQGPPAEHVPGWQEREPMKWFYESNHFTPALGDLIVARILGQAAQDEDFGVKLTSRNINEALELILQGRTLYAAKHADELDWLATIRRKALAKKAKRASMLRLTEGN